VEALSTGKPIPLYDVAVKYLAKDEEKLLDKLNSRYTYELKEGVKQSPVIVPGHLPQDWTPPKENYTQKEVYNMMGAIDNITDGKLSDWYTAAEDFAGAAAITATLVKFWPWIAAMLAKWGVPLTIWHASNKISDAMRDAKPDINVDTSDTEEEDTTEPPAPEEDEEPEDEEEEEEEEEDEEEEEKRTVIPNLPSAAAAGLPTIPYSSRTKGGGGSGPVETPAYCMAIVEEALRTGDSSTVPPECRELLKEKMGDTTYGLRRSIGKDAIPGKRK
jgi:hypothetical protein